MIYTNVFERIEKRITNNITIIRIELIESSNLFDGIVYKIIIRQNGINKYKNFGQNKEKAINYFNNLILKYK